MKNEPAGSDEFWDLDAASHQVVPYVIQFYTFWKFLLTMCTVEQSEVRVILIHILREKKEFHSIMYVSFLA